MRRDAKREPRAEEHPRRVKWVRENRCPHCRKRNQAACPYKVRELHGGKWRCYGYESRHWDERFDFGKEES